MALLLLYHSFNSLILNNLNNSMTLNNLNSTSPPFHWNFTFTDLMWWLKFHTQLYKMYIQFSHLTPLSLTLSFSHSNSPHLYFKYSINIFLPLLYSTVLHFLCWWHFLFAHPNIYKFPHVFYSHILVIWQFHSPSWCQLQWLCIETQNLSQIW